MSERKQIELYAVYNEDGDCEADTDEDTAKDRLAENYGGYTFRTVKLCLDVPLPAAPVEVAITVPEEKTTDAPAVEILDGDIEDDDAKEEATETAHAS